MPRLRKIQRAAVERELKKRKTRGAFCPPAEQKFVPRLDSVLPDEIKPSKLYDKDAALQLYEVEIKQEIDDIQPDPDPLFASCDVKFEDKLDHRFSHSKEIKTECEEQIDPECEHQIEAECKQLIVPECVLQIDPERCKFCLRTLNENVQMQFKPSVRQTQVQRKIEFVLSIRLTTEPLCCVSCWQMIDLFFDFKTSCQKAFFKPDELLRVGMKPQLTITKDSSRKSVENRKQPSYTIVYAPQINATKSSVAATSDVKTEELALPASKVGIPKEFADTLLCPHCPAICDDEKHLQIHISSHGDLRPKKKRKKGIPTGRRLPSKKKNHGDQREYMCTICGATLKSTNSFGNHMAYHAAPTLQCQKCDKKFHTKPLLKKHQSVHSDERNFPCKVCSKRLKSAEALRVHNRIHTNEKPYVCHICDQRFTYNSLLKLHLEKGHEQPGSKTGRIMAVRESSP
ncbi:B-cell lymphoma 6 protein-like isoform X2 [Wyeomyia smithii]|uniref:B-cell lymphoma 6 protein-like isoform X2 n=1 Tax=Wyeomyia smithii TaxID=174621 RepID=UPI002467C503|nr:B-cell lymphoma 6 protein-like isoform X2 [Wyeomyia smithii]